MAQVAHTAPLSISNGLELGQLFWGEVHADPAATAYPRRREVSHRPEKPRVAVLQQIYSTQGTLNLSATQPLKLDDTGLELIELLCQLI